MQTVVPLRRTNISERIAETVRRMIVEGALAGGERINEVRLSQRLGVSRTPLREALSRLAAEGALSSTPSLGFFVRPLTLEEFEQLYDLRPILDTEALRMGGLPRAEGLARLEALNAELLATRDPEAAIAADDAWHLELLAGCPNRLLVEMIEGLMQRTRRYELALMREAPSVAKAGDQHGAILRALKKRDLEGACAALKRNLQSGKEPIVTWLRAREGER